MSRLLTTVGIYSSTRCNAVSSHGINIKNTTMRLTSIILFMLSLLGSNVYAQNCPAYSNTATSSNQGCGNQIYYLEVPNTGCNGTITFTVSGNYGSWGNEITWEVICIQTGGVVASGGPGTTNANFSQTVGPLNPATFGQYYQLYVYDSFGDGFNGGGFIQVTQGATTLAYQDATWSTNEWSMIFGANIDISSSTISVTTPSGVVTSTQGNCLDHSIGFTLDNNNFCTPVVVNLPWTITCDVTSAVLASGTHSVTVNPQIPSSSGDLAIVTWNPATCQWDVTAQNDCDLLDIGTIFNITPDPSTLPSNACMGGSQDFTFDYLGVSPGPDCCSTGGPLVPIQYNASQVTGDATVQTSPFGGTNNSAYLTFPAYGSGGNATSLSLNVNMSGYCFPDPPGTATDDFWVTIYVDGVIIYDNMFTGSSFNLNFNLGSIPGGYNENSVIEIYIYPNSFSSGSEVTTFTPAIPCGSLGNSQWNATTIGATLSVDFEQMAPSPANCSFITPSTFTCCTPAVVTDDNSTVCSGAGTGTLSTWQTAVSTANASCLVYSSVTPVPGTTSPDGVMPDGINGGGSPINQTVSAYAYCDANGSGTDDAGDSYTLLSTYTLTVNPTDDATFSVTPTCDGGTATVSGTAGGTFSFNTPPGDGAVIDPGTGTVTNGTSGATYDILYTTNGPCPASSNIPLTVITTDDPSFTLTATCTGGTATITGTGGGTFSFNTAPPDAAVIDPNTGAITNGNSGNTYDVLYTTNGPCPSSSTQQVTATLTDDPSFTMTPTCVGATVATTATPGGTFGFNPVPGDGAIINSSTGEITNGTVGATYTVEYTTNGSCSATTTVSVTLTNLDDPSFTMTPTCNGATVSSTATAGGTFTFNPAPGDGAAIDPATGEITSGVALTTYTVEYTTGGPCSATTTVNVTLTALDDPSFSMAPTCDGATVTSTATPGGIFSFNVAPGDGAIIDGATGTITGGTPGTSYDVMYNTGSTCADSSTQTVTAFGLPLAPLAGGDATYCSTDTYSDMTATGTGGTYTWYTDTALTQVFGTGAAIAPGEIIGTTIYYVTETVNGCEGPEDMVTITIEYCDIVIPTAFTPDNDNINDYWNIQDLDLVYPNSQVKVYDRWGNMIYESTPGSYDSDPWRGTYKGEALPVGSYYFIIELNDKNNDSKKGTVTIVLNK